MNLTKSIVVIVICIVAYWWWSTNQVPTAALGDTSDVQEAVTLAATATAEPPAPVAQGRVVEYTEADINERFASLGLEGAQITGVTLLQDTVVLGFQVAGLQSEMRMGVQAIDGAVRLQNPQIEGMLASVLPVDQVVTTIETQINERIVQQSPVTAIRIVPGAIVVTYSE